MNKRMERGRGRQTVGRIGIKLKKDSGSRRSRRSRNRRDEGSACNKGPKKDQRTVEEVGEKEGRQESR